MKLYITNSHSTLEIARAIRNQQLYKSSVFPEAGPDILQVSWSDCGPPKSWQAAFIWQADCTGDRRHATGLPVCLQFWWIRNRDSTCLHPWKVWKSVQVVGQREIFGPHVNTHAHTPPSSSSSSSSSSAPSASSASSSSSSCSSTHMYACILIFNI